MPVLKKVVVVIGVLTSGMQFCVKAADTAANAGDEHPHWAFQPLRLVTPPEDSSGWAEQPIDKFVIARLREKDLHPVELADKRTLIRRASFDLIGLPPTPEEIDAFLADE